MASLVFVAEPPDGVLLPPLAVRKSLGAYGTVKSCVPRNGSFIVSFASAPLNMPASITTNAGIITIRETHDSSEALKGTVFSRELIGVSVKDLLSELGEQVVDCQELKTREKETASGRFMLSFRGLVPEYVHLECGLALSVRAHVPAPLRCRDCFKYTHHQRSCKNDRICPNCGALWHGDACTAPPRCAACGGDHPVTSSECQTWQREQGIKSISFTEKISFEEARKRYNKRHPEVPVRPAAVPPSISCTTSFPPVSRQRGQHPNAEPVSFTAVLDTTAAPQMSAHTVRAPRNTVEPTEASAMDRLLLALTSLEAAIVGQNNLMQQLVTQNQRLIDHLITRDTSHVPTAEPPSPVPDNAETFVSTPTSAESTAKRPKRKRAKSTSAVTSAKADGVATLPPSTQRIDFMFKKAEGKVASAASVVGVAVPPVPPEPPEPLVTVEEEN